MSKNTSIIRTRSQMVLTEQDEQQIRATVQQMFYENGGEYPSTEAVYEKLHRIYPLERIEEHLTDPEVIEKFRRLGIKTTAPVGGVLTPQQILVANKIFNFHDKDSMRMFLENLGVTTAQYSAWLRDPVFQEHLSKRADDYFKNADHIANRELVKAMDRGDQNAIKLYLEMRGRYSRNINVNFSVTEVVVKFTEIIVKHVKDPNVIEAIASEIEELTSGG